MISSDDKEIREDAQPSDDVDFEPEDELGDVGALRAKLKKLHDELAEVKKQRAEYLDGWQRAKADLINSRRESSDAIQSAGSRARENFIESLLPAIDSFDMAMQGDTWNSVDPTWRKGVESIQNQLHAVLKKYGIETFGKVGDEFDANLHEAIQELEGVGGPNTVAKVFRSGYRSGDHILRPAQVALVATT